MFNLNVINAYLTISYNKLIYNLKIKKLSLKLLIKFEIFL